MRVKVGQKPKFSTSWAPALTKKWFSSNFSHWTALYQAQNKSMYLRFSSFSSIVFKYSAFDCFCSKYGFKIVKILKQKNWI